MTTARNVSDATLSLIEEMRAEATPSHDKLDALRAEIAKLRDKEFEIAGLEARVTELNKEVQEIKWKTLPDLFDSAGVNRLGIDAHGNLPPYLVEISDHYKAVLPEEHKAEAFEYLRSIDQEDLIKTDFKISFGLREAEATERFRRSLDNAGIQYSTTEGVPWNTLSVWFREEYKKKPLTARAMEILGATVGRVAKVVKQKEKK